MTSLYDIETIPTLRTSSALEEGDVTDDMVTSRGKRSDPAVHTVLECNLERNAPLNDFPSFIVRIL